MTNNLLPVASAGFKYIGYAFLAFIVFTIFDFDFLSFLSFVLVVTFAFMYRNPEREVISFEKNSLLSPIDGKVISIEDIQDPDYSYKIRVDNSYLDISVLRVPFDATVKSINTKRGSRLASSSTLFDDINENSELVFVDENSNMMKVKHKLKRSFDTINIDVIKSQNVKQSFRYGVMLNGITEIYLPKNFRINVTVANELKGSQTLIGYFS